MASPFSLALPFSHFCLYARLRDMGILCVILASVRNLWHANTLPLACTACDLPLVPPERLTTGHHSTGDAVLAEFLELSGIFSLALTLAVPLHKFTVGTDSWSLRQGHFNSFHAYSNLWPSGGPLGVTSGCISCSQAPAWTYFCRAHFWLV